MKVIEWGEDKNQKLKAERGISFEEALLHIMEGDLLDIIEHPNEERYPNQRIFVIRIEEYVYLLPFVEDEQKIFLKTIIPSRKMTKIYLGDRKNEAQ